MTTLVELACLQIGAFLLVTWYPLWCKSRPSQWIETEVLEEMKD